MKGSISIIALILCIFFLLQPVAGACNRSVIPEVIVTYWEPGPDGSIYVESSPPGAIISVNGDNHGHAPVTVSGLWPGTYTVTASMAASCSGVRSGTLNEVSHGTTAAAGVSVVEEVPVRTVSCMTAIFLS